MIGACPKIYEQSSESKECIAVGCPEVIEAKDNYLIIGERIDPKEFGLEGKVSQTEVLVRVPRKLIDDKGK